MIELELEVELPCRVAVCLTFDFDAESGWLGSYKTDLPTALSRGTYGAREGVRRILNLLEEYRLPATFFVPGDSAERHPELVHAMLEGGHEVGHHGYLHLEPASLSLSEERAEIERGFEALDRVAGVRPVGYRAPAWELSKDTFNLLLEYGFQYDSSELGADRPYWIPVGPENEGIVEVPSAWELCDSSLFMFSFTPSYISGMATPTQAVEIWKGDFDGMVSEGHGSAFVLTTHPETIGRHHRIDALRQLIEHMQNGDGVKFSTMQRVSEDFRSIRQDSVARS